MSSQLNGTHGAIDWRVLMPGVGMSKPAAVSTTTTATPATASAASTSSLAAQIASQQLTIHSLLLDIHQLTLDRASSHSLLTHSHSQLTALTANLQDAFAIQQQMQVKIQVLEYGLKIERKENRKLREQLTALQGGGAATASPAATTAPPSTTSSSTSQPSSKPPSGRSTPNGSHTKENGIKPTSPSSPSPSSSSLLPSVIHLAPGCSIDASLFQAYLTGVSAISHHHDESLPSPLPPGTGVSSNAGGGGSRPPGAGHVSMLSNMTSSLPIKVKAVPPQSKSPPAIVHTPAGAGGVGVGGAPGQEGDLSFSYTKNAHVKHPPSAATSSHPNSGNNSAASTVTSRSKPPGGATVDGKIGPGTFKPPTLSASMFMPPTADEIAAEIDLAKSPTGGTPFMKRGSVKGPAGSARNRSDSEQGRSTASSSVSSTSSTSSAAAAAAAAHSYVHAPSASHLGGGQHHHHHHNTNTSSSLPASGSSADLGKTTIYNYTQSSSPQNVPGGVLSPSSSSAAPSSSANSTYSYSVSPDGPPPAAAHSPPGTISIDLSGIGNHPPGNGAAAASSSAAPAPGTHTRLASSSTSAFASVAQIKQWRPKLVLRSHFDSVRNVSFDKNPESNLMNEIYFLSTSEDGTTQLWNLSTSLLTSSKAKAVQPLPIHTYRGHAGIVTAGMIDSSRNLGKGCCVTVGVDGKLIQWSLPRPDEDMYASYGQVEAYKYDEIMMKDAVWSVDVCNDVAVLAVANGTVCVVKLAPNAADVSVGEQQQQSRLLHEIHLSDSTSPTSVTFLTGTSGSRAVVGCTDGTLRLLDIESGKQLLIFQESASADVGNHHGVHSRCTQVLSHPSLPSQIISSHIDSSIRVWDSTTHQRIMLLPAHRTSVSCLALDSDGQSLCTGSHDESIRIWSTNSQQNNGTNEYKIRQVLDTHQTHRMKYDEAIHSVAYHPSLPYLASAGADGLVKVYI